MSDKLKLEIESFENIWKGGFKSGYKRNQRVLEDYLKTNLTGSETLLDRDGFHRPGRWYWLGINRFVELCENHNFEIINRDLDIDKTNPITLIKK